MKHANWWATRGGPSALYFLQGMALAMWMVPLSRVLDAHGLPGIKSYAFATMSLAALVSPLVFGAMADRHVSPVRVMRFLAVITGMLTAASSIAIERGAGPVVVLGLVQLQSLAFAPSWSLLNTIALTGMTDAKRQFGPVRAMGTLGWIAGCWAVSVLRADSSTLAGYSGSFVWLLVSATTLTLPAVRPPAVAAGLTFRERLGLDALTLMRHPDHRVVLLTAGLVAIPLAAFYPFTPPHLEDLGLERTSAWMSLGQVTEVAAMFGLAALLGRWRLKWVFASGLACAAVRYLLCAVGTLPAVLAGVTLHGFAYTLFFVTAPIYLNERVDAEWRARAQALMSLMTMGVGSLLGYLGAGWWYDWCHGPDGRHWTLFWSGLAVAVVAVLVYFLGAYRGRGRGGGDSM